MITTPALKHTLTHFSSPTLRRSGRICFAFCLAGTLLLPLGVRSEEAATLAPPVAELALHELPAAAGPGIRMKLHGVEDLRETAKTGSDTAAAPDTGASGATAAGPAADTTTAVADEIKKQAQTKYLAAKLRKQEDTVRQYVDLAWAEAYRRDWLAPELLIAIIHKESAFRPKVQSRYGAQGLMQVVRRWHRDKLHPSESLFDPEVNIRVGADVLEEYLALANGNLDHALRKYSGNARNYANAIKKETLALARVAERAASRAVVSRG